MSRPVRMKSKYLKGRHIIVPHANSIYRSKWATHSYIYKEISGELVEKYLIDTPGFLERFLMRHVSDEQIHTWKAQKLDGGKNLADEKSSDNEKMRLSPDNIIDVKHSTISYESCVSRINSKLNIIQDITKRQELLQDLVTSIANALVADDSHLYLVNSEKNLIYHYDSESDNTITNSAVVRSIGPGSILAAYVASTLKCKIITDISSVLGSDENYPEGILFDDPTIQSVLCQPIFMENGKVLGVVELYRFVGRQPFMAHDAQVSEGFSTWTCLAAYYGELYFNNREESLLNGFIMAVTKSIFSKTDSMDNLIIEIMKFGKNLVKADRSALFMIDNVTQTLVSRVFDKGSQFEVRDSIRFALSKGIAGYVATTGETLRIPNAYDDPRFNRDIDKMTGYHTRAILCMAVRVDNNIVGVLEMINKQGGEFTEKDEKYFETFCVYCGLALNIADMHIKLARSQAHYKVSLEVLHYHNKYTKNELKQLRSYKMPKQVPGLDHFEIMDDISDSESMNPPINQRGSVRSLTNNLDGISIEDLRFDVTTMARFVLTVRKNYRKVPYHNWGHAFSVTHSMFCILTSTRQKYTIEEQIAMLVSCVCHDLDHRGKTNAYMNKFSDSAIAQLYTTSTMEYHHFNITVMILQMDGHNIFHYLSVATYKKILELIKYCILATDLAKFFGYKAQLEKIAYTNPCTFEWENNHHRSLLMAICMTTSDLCSMYKPWRLQAGLVMFIMAEFWVQGDCEKAAGITPIAMMDRDFRQDLPESQVGFLKAICLPCYTVVYRLLPEIKIVVKSAKNNLRTWKSLTLLPFENKLERLAQLAVIPEHIHMA